MPSGEYPDGRSNLGYNYNEVDYIQLDQSESLIEIIHKISELLHTGLSAESIDICVKLIEAGVHPQALAEIIKQIRGEVQILQQPEQ